VKVFGKGHEIDIRGIQHQFDRQQNHDDVTPDQHAYNTGEKHEPAQDQIVG